MIRTILHSGGPSRLCRRSAALLAFAWLLAGVPAAGAHPVQRPAYPTQAPYVPGQLIVGYLPPIASVAADIRSWHAARVSATPSATATAAENALPGTQIVHLKPGSNLAAAAASIRRLPGITYAVPDYLARVTGTFIPNDPGRTKQARGWQGLQWNFLAKHGVDAPTAWANLIADKRAGARGVVVAVLDTGVAFRNWDGFQRSPDFAGTRFVDPCDLVAGHLSGTRCSDPYPLDREGHGTFVAGTIAEATNNGVGLTGLAYNASVMPIRVLDARGLGESTAIASGIRYAVEHGAQVINLSLEFYLGVTAADIPDIISAIRYAHAHGVVVVAAAGNDGADQLAYPARAPAVIAVGATTIDRCLADYSDVGSQLDLVAPGGGSDTTEESGDPDCHPARNLPDVYQMTFNNPAHPNDFSLPGTWYGTSMAAPVVSAAAAMVIASGVIGDHPTPAQILARLEATAIPLGHGTPNPDYGYGLVDIGAATAPLATTTPATPSKAARAPATLR